MSKSLGNGIDPLLVIEKYGADALRFALATGNSPGNDMRFSDEKIESARNFANKLWNAARFVLMNLDIESVELPSADKLAPQDKWILTKLNAKIGEVRAALDKYEIGIALSVIYDFVWDIFCDWYIELSKTTLSDKGSEANMVSQNVIAYVLENILKLLHPFMPFITEEIYQSVPHTEESESIMIAAYPAQNDALDFAADAEIMENVIEAITAIRARRAEMNVPPSRKANVYIVSSRADVYNESTFPFFTKLASASAATRVDAFEGEKAVQIITPSATIYIPMSDMVDTEKERARLMAELAKTEEEILRLVKKLSNEGFVAKAPAAVVDGERAKLEKYKSTKAGIEEAIAAL